ncbi:Tn3 family transposase [Clostridium perfringens]|uniref:Tn3 family transposase n=1 Tax=Clostridium perfringens TaxID=1502 RepID=UPI0039EA403F
MVLIEKTIYPRFNKNITKSELIDYYTPSDKEINLAYRNTNGQSQVCIFLVFLKSFEKLKYFPKYNSIPKKIFKYIQDTLLLNIESDINISEKTLQRYKHIIRRFLNIKNNKVNRNNLIINTVEKFEPITEYQEDVFNAVIETLLKNDFELPSFKVLDRIILNKRTKINDNLFNLVANRLTIVQKETLDNMLLVDNKGYSIFNELKELPKNPTLNHLKDTLKNYIRLKKFGFDKKFLIGIHHYKIKYFASYGRSLDASEMKDFNKNKRYTILICFLYFNTIRCCDDLITMFIKRVNKIHNKAKENLELTLEKQRVKTENIVEVLQELLTASHESKDNNQIVSSFKNIIAKRGGYENLINDCNEITAYNNKNYYPMLWKYFKSHRKTLFEILKILNIGSTTENNSIVEAINYLIKCEHKKSEFIPANIDISFINEKWRNLIISKLKREEVFPRRYFELCIFSYIAFEFKTGDLYVENSEEYADYRKQLLPWDECNNLLLDYCKELKLPPNKEDFIINLKAMLELKCNLVDKSYPDNSELIINNNGEVMIKKIKSKRDNVKSKKFKRLVEKYMPERNITEILCNIEHWVNYTKHFGPLSGSDPKFKNAKERYILLTFGYGSNMGPAQTSKHIRDSITPHMISFTNKRHITVSNLERALTDVINFYNKFSLPKVWGKSNIVATDGTQLDTYSQNLLAENHIRYGGIGGIVYNHVSDTYIALFNHFIPCGVWEAVYIIDGLLKNKSDIKPNTVHADTQGQSTTVFALTYLLGINLMPRIRNWKDLNFYKAEKNLKYSHIDVLFNNNVIDWNLIKTHYKDLFQVVLSIKAGKFLPSTLLRKLNNNSRKNKLYKAFRELGNVIRTLYLLEFISNVELREKITESTNKVEAYNWFLKWFFFGGEGIIGENDPDEQNKIIKYNELLANSVILHNVIDISNVLKKIVADGVLVTKYDIQSLSPYMTSHIKRFGEYVIDLNKVPGDITEIDIEKIIKPVT